MIRMKKMVEFSTANYEGFTLKSGYFYGHNLRGQAIATSGWVSGGAVALYTRTERGWEMEWTEIDRFAPETREALEA